VRSTWIGSWAEYTLNLCHRVGRDSPTETDPFTRHAGCEVARSPVTHVTQQRAVVALPGTGSRPL
jgi:hypothetical protein